MAETRTKPTDSIQLRWETAHDLPRFRPRYPHEEVVRWTFRNFDTNATPKLKVLDHGCGAGRHALFFAVEGFDVYACDISRSGLHYLQNSAQQRGLSLATRQCQGYDLSDYSSDSFDAVLSYGVLYYMTLDEAQRAVQEIHRILRVGGKFCCVIRTDEDSRRKYATKVGP